jgi:hypothetical protein
MNVKKKFNTLLRIRGDIPARSLTFHGLSAESQNFLRITYTAERHVIHELFCAQAGFLKAYHYFYM